MEESQGRRVGVSDVAGLWSWTRKERFVLERVGGVEVGVGVDADAEALDELAAEPAGDHRGGGAGERQG
jgi:hypothetical protein